MTTSGEGDPGTDAPLSPHRAASSQGVALLVRESVLLAPEGLGAVTDRLICASCGEYEDQCLGHERWEGDGPCGDCGGQNMRWFTDSPMWNLVMGGPDAPDDPGGVVCPYCFVKRALAAGIDPPAWRLTLEGTP